ncbi:hypothetical protein BDV06DRAFT_221511 [Aspergillus oleicola]
MNCSSAHQWALANNGSVEFDADIVGPGVIVSFISAALTAVITLFFAFITYSIPEELTNDVDGVVARALRAIFTFIRTTLHLTKHQQLNGEEARENRLKAVQTFMLSVSDQVLASEMAILIATFARYSDITLYSVNVVVALGCLASTVHLAMMPLLVRQIREHHVIKASRSISMVIAAILLVVLLILQISDTWTDGTHIYFQCALHDFQVDPSSIGENWVGFVTQLLVPIFIIYGNYEVIRLLYSKNNTHDPRSSVQADRASEPTTRLARISQARRELGEMRKHSQQSRIRRRWSRHRANGIIQSKISPRRQRIQAIIIAETWTFYECQESFLWRILWLISGNIYGITDVFQNRSDTTGISGDRDTMGYGQIVPLVLLILPIFSAIQSIYDYRDRIKTIQQQNESSGRSSTLTDISESPVDLEAAHESSTDSARVDNWPAPGELSRSTTTATDSHPPSTAMRRRSKALSSGQTLEDEHIPGVYTSPTIDLLDTADQNFQSYANADRSLRQWALHNDYQRMPFVQVASYAHTVAMLAFVALFGWTMAAGPWLLTVFLLAFLMLIVSRRLFGVFYFWSFARRHEKEDPNQGHQSPDSVAQKLTDPGPATLQAHGANEVAEGGNE